MKNSIFWDVNDVSEEHIASMIRVTRISEIGTLSVAINRITLQTNNTV
jgi:hypothetical protein